MVIGVSECLAFECGAKKRKDVDGWIIYEQPGGHGSHNLNVSRREFPECGLFLTLSIPEVGFPSLSSVYNRRVMSLSRAVRHGA